ncbi:MAG TPA: sugar phosphate nucleotidyltransferase [Solirubrobacteraceae bacterium]|jgi:glucose-1-phosphate thymidylyltransferase
MKGVILAGGKATRLRPLTQVTNKHLLPIYDKPLIYYPLEAMARAGVEEVLLTTNPEHAGHFLQLLGSGREFGLRLTIELQESANGLADAVGLAEHFARGSKVLVLLGDNIFTHDLAPRVQAFEQQERGAVIFATEVDEPQHYGVIEVDGDRVVGIEEKPEHPRSNLAQTGIYLYDERVFSFISELEPSSRGELEITDLNNRYVDEGTLACDVLNGYWIDAGTSHDELLAANNEVARLRLAGEL